MRWDWSMGRESHLRRRSDLFKFQLYHAKKMRDLNISIKMQSHPSNSISHHRIKPRKVRPGWSIYKNHYHQRLRCNKKRDQSPSTVRQKLKVKGSHPIQVKNRIKRRWRNKMWRSHKLRLKNTKRKKKKDWVGKIPLYMANLKLKLIHKLKKHLVKQLQLRNKKLMLHKFRKCFHRRNLSKHLQKRMR